MLLKLDGFISINITILKINPMYNGSLGMVNQLPLPIPNYKKREIKILGCSDFQCKLDFSILHAN